MKFLFVTTSNLATNPRLVKELYLASLLKFDVEVIQFNIDNWSHTYTQQIKSNFPKVNFIEIEAGRKSLIPWFVSSLLEKVFTNLPYKIIPINWLSISLYKRSFLLQKNFRKVTSRPDLIIAHNPGSFYPSMKLANVFNTEFAIDVEDYHPGETRNPQLSKKIKYMMQKVLPKAKYVSFASKLILEQVKRDMYDSNLTLNNTTLIANLFSKDEFIRVTDYVLDQSKLNFVWFSQNIDYLRGLESILSVLDEVKDDVTLTLIGNVRNGFFKKEITHRNYLRLEKPMAQAELHSILSNFDIGLALETKTSDYNRDICLTNKIWSYLQSGIYILATSTSAQIDFINEFSSNGVVLFNNKEQALIQVKNMIQKKEQIRQGSVERRLINDSLNWEKESVKLRTIWK